MTWYADEIILRATPEALAAVAEARPTEEAASAEEDTSAEPAPEAEPSAMIAELEAEAAPQTVATEEPIAEPPQDVAAVTEAAPMEDAATGIISGEAFATEPSKEDIAAAAELADAELARIRQQALLFTQASVTADAHSEPPLAYVPPLETHLPAIADAASTDAAASTTVAAEPSPALTPA